MDDRIEEKPERILTGYKRFFTGTPAERLAQKENFYATTWVNQCVLKGLANDTVTSYGIMTNFREVCSGFRLVKSGGLW